MRTAEGLLEQGFGRRPLSALALAVEINHIKEGVVTAPADTGAGLSEFSGLSGRRPIRLARRTPTPTAPRLRMSPSIRAPAASRCSTIWSSTMLAASSIRKPCMGRSSEPGPRARQHVHRRNPLRRERPTAGRIARRLSGAARHRLSSGPRDIAGSASDTEQPARRQRRRRRRHHPGRRRPDQRGCGGAFLVEHRTARTAVNAATGLAAHCGREKA